MKFFSTILCFLFLFSCKESSVAPEPQPQPVAEETRSEETKSEDISVEEARQLLQEGQNIQIIDVRTPEETNEGIIEGAILADINSQDFPAIIEGLDPEKTYLVYCAVGGRSKTASGYLQSKGFKHVYNLAGGYKAWTADQ